MQRIRNVFCVRKKSCIFNFSVFSQTSSLGFQVCRFFWLANMTLTHASPSTSKIHFHYQLDLLINRIIIFSSFPQIRIFLGCSKKKTKAEPIMFANMFLLSLLTIIYGTKGDDAGGGGVAGRNALNFLPDLSQQQHSGMQRHKVAAYHVQSHRLTRCSGKSRFRDNFL